jgi:DNA-binding NarL/FixJ family response regulator
MRPIAVALIDDQPLFVSGFRELVQRDPLIRLAAISARAADAASIVTRCSPDILFIDVATVEDAFQAITTVPALSPNLKIVALTAARGISFAMKTLDAGVHGYVLKQSNGDDILAAIQAVRSGEKFITHGFASKIVSALQDEAVRKNAALAVKLSIRENQVVRLLLAGKTNKEIALTLSISEKTVKHYMTVLMQKLNARNRVEVVIAAQRLSGDSARADIRH